MDLLPKKMDVLAKDFEAAFGVPLWRNVPLVAIADLVKPVGDHDALKARLASLAAVFDHFNKKAFDGAVGTASTGTRKALVSFMKLRLPDLHPQIEAEVERPMGLICLLRDYLLHTRNDNYKKAFAYFSLSDPIDDAVAAWNQVLFRFSEWVDAVRGLLIQSARPRRSGNELSEESLRFLVAVTYRRRKELLESDAIAPVINEIIRRGDALDTDLARTFGRSVEDLRRLLFDLTTDVVIVTPVDRQSTRLRISGALIEAIQSRGQMIDGAAT